MAIEPSQLGKRGKALDVRELSRVVFSVKDPADVRVPEAAPWVVRITRTIRVFVVPAMPARPPQRASLQRGGAECREYELERATRPECAMSEVAMVARRDRPHPDGVPARREQYECGRRWIPEDADACGVNTEERQRPP